MNIGTIIRDLIEKYGEKGLLQEARAIEGGAVKSVKDIKPTTLERIRTRKTGIKRDAPEIPEEEARAFGQAIEEGSDVAEIYKERNLPAIREKNLPAVITEKSGLPSLQARVKESPIGETKGAPQLPAGQQQLQLPVGQQQLQLPAGQFEREVPSPAATLSEMESAASSSLKGRIDRFKAPAAVAGGLGLAGSYAATQEEPARFPGDMSQAEVMTERTAQLAPSTPSAISKETPAEKTKPSGPVRRPTTLAETLGRGPVPEREPSAYETGMESLQQERAAAKEEQRAEMDQLAKGELASLIGRSLAQIGAAATGMQKGIDMSGVAQKEMVDWDKRRALVASQYEQRVKELEADRARLERVKERTEDKEERAKIAARQEELAKDERKFKAEEAAKDREAAEAIELLKAYRDKDPEARKKIQARAGIKVKQIDRQIAALDKIDGMFEPYAAASSDKKKAEETKIRKALRTLMGPEAVAGEKKSFLGVEYDDKKSVDQIMTDIAKYKADLQRSRDIQEQISLGLEEQAAPATVETPAAAPVQETELQRKERRRQELLNKAKGQ